VQVGRYQILDTIGTGANSRVVRAFDPMIGRTVAIKLFPSQLASGEGRERFIKEARVVGQISHPSIVALHDMGIEESTSTPYLVMEYVEGQPLERLLDILISEEGRVKLTDFGMARLASRDSVDSPLLGTPAYWCPEQILGKPQDARSDIFSLGVVLYEMITGYRPFDSDSLQGICSRVLSSTPLPPSHTNPSLPAGLNELVAACLAKDPAHRSNSADDLADDLYAFARRKPVAQQPTTPQESTSLRHRAAKLLRSA
jgi:serine/threonine protein kinase